MKFVFYCAAFILTLCMGVMLYCTISKKNDIYSRLLVVNNFSTQAILFIAIMSVIVRSSFLLDVALVYASISFISTVAFMKFFLDKSFE
ncbi:monovalent cation/H+ antiporter complex subunit F [Candidatus Mesenet endosymbiont of Agriotes lineatus]|uniref:monovalent cation/H+ antiporter complex subunit F n=1 Tax=Candidatus Mesenet endosymbiont of Agriotes lineatus TaxID=3077948 RepID=UPI0030CD85AA